MIYGADLAKCAEDHKYSGISRNMYKLLIEIMENIISSGAGIDNAFSEQLFVLIIFSSK